MLPSAASSAAAAPTGSTSSRAEAASRASASSSRGFSATAFSAAFLRVGEPLVGDVQIGQEHLCRSIVRVDRQRTLRLGPAGRQPVALEIGLTERHQDLGGQRVDLLGAGQLLDGRPLVVSREEELPLQPRGLPAVGIGAERGLVDLVDHVVERIGQLLAPRRGAIVALGGLADQQQVLGIPGQIGRPGVVVVDEPLAGLDRLLELAPRLEQPGRDPAGRQVVRAGLESLLDRGVGGLPVPAVELKLGQPRQARRRSWAPGRPGPSGRQSPWHTSPWLAWHSAFPSVMATLSFGGTPPGCFLASLSAEVNASSASA